MLVFQILLVACVIALSIYTLRSEPGTVHLAVRRAFLMVTAFIAVYFVVFPGSLSELASFFGVGRGTDLLVYGLVIIFLLSAISQRRQILAGQRISTKLAREIAITNALRDNNI